MMFGMYADVPTVFEVIDLMAAEMRSPGGVGEVPPNVRGWTISEVRRHGYGGLVVLSGPNGSSVTCSLAVSVVSAT